MQKPIAGDMNTKEIYYSIQNGGDGSTYLWWFESMALADLDQQYMDEGWAETCVGSVVVQGEGEFEFLNEVRTVDDVIRETKEDLQYHDPGDIWYDTLTDKIKDLEKMKNE